MIISHKYNFIFIKTRKTAGTSIEVFLSQFCGETDILTPIYPPVEPHVSRNYKGFYNIFDEGMLSLKQIYGKLYEREKFYNHIPAKLVKKRIGKKIWGNYFKFCVDRNPWDKTLSQYHNMNHTKGGALSFEEYIANRRFPYNYPLYTEDDVVIVDRILRYETLMDDLSEVFSKLGIPFSGSLGVNAKSEYRKDKTPYQDIYTKEQKEIIEKYFEKEIKLLNYSY
jgi:hypothetical protein